MTKIDSQQGADARALRSDAPWRHLPGIGATLAVVLVHGGHELAEGSGWRQILLPSVVILVQCAALTACHHWIRSKGAFLLTGALVSALSGLAFGALHTDPSLSIPGVGGVLVGLAFWGFWALAFRLPQLLQESRWRAVEVDRVRREAELARIRSSLHPHFLLNTLNTIAALLEEEPAVARRLLVTLGDLLRDAVDPGPELRPLSQDVAWLRRYASILEIRHGSLRFEWELDERALAFPLPRLLLQPLVENAVSHGALRHGEGGVVTIRARQTDGRLRLEVEDNGPGLGPSCSTGLGLRLVRERLAVAWPAAELKLESSPTGLRAIVDIPEVPA